MDWIVSLAQGTRFVNIYQYSVLRVWLTQSSTYISNGVFSALHKLRVLNFFNFLALLTRWFNAFILSTICLRTDFGQCTSICMLQTDPCPPILSGNMQSKTVLILLIFLVVAALISLRVRDLLAASMVFGNDVTQCQTNDNCVNETFLISASFVFGAFVSLFSKLKLK